MNKRMIALISTMLITALTGCSSAASNNSPANNGGSGAKPETLRIAMGSPGEGLIKVWETIGKEFEAQHQGIKVEFSYQDDDTYQTIGLPNLLSGKNAPDLYFEWAGQRLQTRVTDGYAADITEQAPKLRTEGYVRGGYLQWYGDRRQDVYDSYCGRCDERNLLQ